MQNRSAAIQGLASIKDKYDDFLSKVNSNKGLYENKNFVWRLLAYPFLNWKDVTGFGEGLTRLFSFLSSPAPIILGIAGYFGMDSLPSEVNFRVLTVNTEVLKWLVPILGYLVSVGANFLRMTTVSDPKFHIEAYKFFRKDEWDLFYTYLDASPFTFNHLYDQVKIIDYRLEQQAEKIEERFENQKREYESMIQQLEGKLTVYKERYSRLVGEYETALEMAELEQQVFEKEVRYLADLIGVSSTVLERLCRGHFSTSDLAVISDFSLYELRGRELILIDNKGLTNAKDVIPIDDVKYRNWSVVRAAKLKEEKPVEGWSKRGRRIISHRFTMPDQTVWVYNFHINSFDERASVLTNNDIMLTREVYRLIYAICIHLHRKRSPEEVVNNE
ncbi:hypothetical protein ABEV55_16125 [Aneurinibacillus thermoaerophilus]|uniref:hypothetical protein n=1 Tax=Aneurinibacillus thermoaerophilus TaxID=143495 RepID=UPI002E22EA6E|nr:hypothetical protein [Aneurinibacillus thermoaerophilus]